jgi:hypothetical protein
VSRFADEIGVKPDISTRMSAVRGEAEVQAYPSELPLIAKGDLSAERNTKSIFALSTRLK